MLETLKPLNPYTSHLCRINPVRPFSKDPYLELVCLRHPAEHLATAQVPAFELPKRLGEEILARGILCSSILGLLSFDKRLQSRLWVYLKRCIEDTCSWKRHPLGNPTLRLLRNSIQKGRFRHTTYYSISRYPILYMKYKESNRKVGTLQKRVGYRGLGGVPTPQSGTPCSTFEL